MTLSDAQPSVSAHHPAPFVEQTENAKRQRTDRVLTILDYQSKLRDCLQLVSKTCSLCFVSSSPYDKPNHTFSICQQRSKSEFFQWRRGIKYAKGIAVCYQCHVPQGKDDVLHPTFTRNATECEFRDVVAPVVFGLLKRPDILEQLRKAFPGLDTSTPMSALAWINSKEIEGHLTNLTALFYWFCHQYL
jgi:hypothetical protein